SLWFKSTAVISQPLWQWNLNQTGIVNSLSYYPALIINQFGAVELDAGSSTITSTQFYNDGNWHHVAVSFVSGGPSTLYVDGVSVATGSGTIGASFSGYQRIGRGDAAAFLRFLNGTISKVAYFTTALNAGQIVTIFNSQYTSGATEQDAVVLAFSPQNYWKLNETSGTSAADSAGSNTGTYTGGFTLNQSSNVLVPVGTPAIAWTTPFIQGAQYQNLQGRVALSSGSLVAATTAAGSGGGGSGGGGGGGSCFS